MVTAEVVASSSLQVPINSVSGRHSAQRTHARQMTFERDDKWESDNDINIARLAGPDEP